MTHSEIELERFSGLKTVQDGSNFVDVVSSVKC
jgi:hypothetical protein